LDIYIHIYYCFICTYIFEFIIWYTCKVHWITLNMVYGVSKELSHKILFHNPCSLKLIDSSQLVMELGIPIVKTITHRIFVIYLNQAKLEASGWCIGVMHWMDLGICFSMKIPSKGKTHTLNITYDINSKSWKDCVLRC
jgi:hypothetical protein